MIQANNLGIDLKPAAIVNYFLPASDATLHQQGMMMTTCIKTGFIMRGWWFVTEAFPGGADSTACRSRFPSLLKGKLVSDNSHLLSLYMPIYPLAGDV